MELRQTALAVFVPTDLKDVVIIITALRVCIVQDCWMSYMLESWANTSGILSDVDQRAINRPAGRPDIDSWTLYPVSTAVCTRPYGSLCTSVDCQSWSLPRFSIAISRGSVLWATTSNDRTQLFGLNFRSVYANSWPKYATLRSAVAALPASCHTGFIFHKQLLYQTKCQHF